MTSAITDLKQKITILKYFSIKGLAYLEAKVFFFKITIRILIVFPIHLTRNYCNYQNK